MKVSRFNTALAALFLVVLLATGRSGIPVSAASGLVDGDKAGQADGPAHCITGPGEPTRCFKTEAEALYSASGGRISLRPDQSSRSMADSQLFYPGSNLYAILYEHANYGGSTLSIYGNACSGGNNMPAGWNDVASSARTGTCGLTLYEHYNFTGAYLKISYPGTSYVGPGMNDKASSWSLP